MPPKGRHEKAVAKDEREASKKAASKQKEQQDKEDQFWKEAGEGQTSKAAAKRAEEEAKRAEAAAKRAEAKRLAEEEEARLSASKAKAAPAGVQKVTKHQLDMTRDLEAKQKQEEAKERMLALKRELSEEQYARLVELEIKNRGGAEDVDARSVTAALEQLGLGGEGGGGEGDKHPEKRMRAAFKEYEEANLPGLKADKPGLKMSQYKDMLWKMWQKAPENPMVQAGRR